MIYSEMAIGEASSMVWRVVAIMVDNDSDDYPKLLMEESNIFIKSIRK